jgi:hypothetical protein
MAIRVIDTGEKYISRRDRRRICNRRLKWIYSSFSLACTDLLTNQTRRVSSARDKVTKTDSQEIEGSERERESE